MVKPKNDRNLKFRDGAWYVDFTHRGKRIRQFAGYTKEQARNTLAKFRLDRLDEKLGFKKPGSGEPIPFETFADEFLETYCKQNKRSWARDELSLKTLKKFFRGETLQSIGPEDVERFKAKRRTDHLMLGGKLCTPLVSPSTVNRELACLKTLFNKAIEWGKIEVNPLRAIKKFKENNVREMNLSASEAQQLIENASLSIRPILIIALNTGMRRNEILSLKWQSVDLSRRYIFIEDSKSGKSRKVPMNSTVYKILNNMPTVSEFIFFNPETKTHIKDIAVAFRAAREKAGLKGLRLHDLRHTAASKMVEAGVDIVTVSKILGHASLQMTMRYAHPTPENMRRAVDRLAEILDSTRQKVDKPSETAVSIETPTNSLLNN
jgi:integrase